MLQDLHQREYYKLFTGPEQNEGFDNIYLGYESKTREQMFKKDSTTVFHFPYFALKTAVSAAKLVEDGATAGPIPALADKIFSCQKGYGETTPWGNTSYYNDGEWFCTWLYSQSGESPVWVDRYYSPGSLSADIPLMGDYVSYIYEVDEKYIFKDIISDRIFEPGVMYRYMHMGEKSAQEQIKTLSGSIGLSGLGLRFSEWVPTAVDASGNNNILQVNGMYTDFITVEKSQANADRYYLDLNKPDYIEYKVPYSSTYNSEYDFSLMCWLKTDDWSSIQTSQIVGNMFDGGYQLRINNHKYTPYFFIADKKYGNLFCLNQEAHNYQSTSIRYDFDVNISNYIVDGNNDLVIICNDSKTIHKIDHLGNSRRMSAKITTDQSVQLYNIVADSNNNYIITSNKYVYTITNELLQDSIKVNDRVCTSLTTVVFDLSGSMHFIDEDLCVIFDDTNRPWRVTYDGQVYAGSAAVSALMDMGAYHVNIDPENNAWVLHSNNYVSKIDSVSLSAVFTLQIGNFNEGETFEKGGRFLTFIYKNNKDNTTEWYASLISNTDKCLHTLNNKGHLVRTTYLPYRCAVKAELNEDIDVIITQDCSSYNWQRVNKHALYKNTSQLEFNVSVRNISTEAFRIFRICIPVTDITNKEWHHVCGVFKGHTMLLYIDNKLMLQKHIDNRYFLNYDSCNSLYIGTPNGKRSNLNTELNVKSIIFRGSIDDLRVYNYAVPSHLLMLFNRAYFVANDMIWNIPTSPIQYVEGIERFFQHKIPGSKSQYYKIRITDFLPKNISDEKRTALKNAIESYILDTIEEVQPFYTELLAIEWV